MKQWGCDMLKIYCIVFTALYSWFVLYCHVVVNMSPRDAMKWLYGFIVLILWWEWPLFSSTFWPVPSVGLDRYRSWQDLYMVTFPSYDLQRSRSGRHYVMVCVWVRERDAKIISSPYFFLFLYPTPLSLSFFFLVVWSNVQEFFADFRSCARQHWKSTWTSFSEMSQPPSLLAK